MTVPSRRTLSSGTHPRNCLEMKVAPPDLRVLLRFPSRPQRSNPKKIHMMKILAIAAALALFAWLVHRLLARLLLSRAKHPSLRGHPRIALRLARWLPYFAYSREELLRSDDAP